MRKSTTYKKENDIFYFEIEENDWRYLLVHYLQNLNGKSEKKTLVQTINYILFHKELYKKNQDDLLSKCLGKYDAMLVMVEV